MLQASCGFAQWEKHVCVVDSCLGTSQLWTRLWASRILLHFSHLKSRIKKEHNLCNVHGKYLASVSCPLGHTHWMGHYGRSHAIQTRCTSVCPSLHSLCDISTLNIPKVNVVIPILLWWLYVPLICIQLLTMGQKTKNHHGEERRLYQNYCKVHRFLFHLLIDYTTDVVWNRGTSWFYYLLSNLFKDSRKSMCLVSFYC